jgi:hypothetical protein
VTVLAAHLSANPADCIARPATLVPEHRVAERHRTVDQSRPGSGAITQMRRSVLSPTARRLDVLAQVICARVLARSAYSQSARDRQIGAPGAHNRQRKKDSGILSRISRLHASIPILSIRARVSSRTRVASSSLVILSARHSPRGFRTITRKLSRLLRRSGGSRVNNERSRDSGTVTLSMTR